MEVFQLFDAPSANSLYKGWYMYSLGNKRIHFFCGKKVFLDTLAAVNIGYDKCPILETC